MQSLEFSQCNKLSALLSLMLGNKTGLVPFKFIERPERKRDKTSRIQTINH